MVLVRLLIINICLNHATNVFSILSTFLLDFERCTILAAALVCKETHSAPKNLDPYFRPFSTKMVSKIAYVIIQNFNTTALTGSTVIIGTKVTPVCLLYRSFMTMTLRLPCLVIVKAFKISIVVIMNGPLIGTNYIHR